MATLQKLRNQAGLLVAIVIFIALAAFILGDLLQSGGSFIQGRQLEVGSINGEKIEYPEFQERLNQLSEIYKQNNQTNNIDEAAYQQIMNQTWENAVRELLMEDVYNNLGIVVTPEEMFELVQGNNIHPIVNQVFGDPQTGQVDKAQIIQFLKFINENPSAPQYASWLNIEREILKAQKSQKYNDLVGKAFYANTLQAEKSMKEKNRVANLKFVQQKFNTVNDSLVTFTDSDLRNYYNENIDLYKQNAQKTISFVTFNIEPSESDENDVVRWINNIKREFENAEDNVQFVNVNSDTRFEDLYEKRSDLTAELGDWAFEASVGDVYGPYKESSVYKLAKLNEIKMMPDSVRASHILLRADENVNPQFVFEVIDSLKNVIEDGQATFEEIAREYSEDGSAPDGGDLGWFGRGRMVQAFEQAAFRADVNELVMVQTQFGFHIIKVTQQSAKTKHVQLAILDREVIPSTATYQRIYAEASRFAADASDLDGFNALAVEQNKTPRQATIHENDRQITGIGAARSIVRSAYVNTKKGELVTGNDRSPVFEIDNRFVIAALVSEQKEGHRSFEDAKTSVEIAVIREKKREMLVEKFNNAKASTIEETAQNLGLEVESANGFNFNFGSVNAIGYEPAVNGAASVLEVNELSDPIAGRNGVYFIQLTSIEGEMPEDVYAEKQELFLNLSNRAGFSAYQTLKDKAEITDSRSKFY